MDDFIVLFDYLLFDYLQPQMTQIFTDTFLKHGLYGLYGEH